MGIFRRSYLLIFLAVVGLIGLGILFFPAKKSDRIKDRIEIPTGSTFDQVLDTLDQNGFVSSRGIFSILATLTGLKNDTPIAGSYLVDKQASYFRIIRLLISGRQTPVKLVLNNFRMAENLAGTLSQLLEPDSLAFLSLFRDSAALSSFNIDSANVLTLIIPNTYEMYWTSSPKDFLERMSKESAKFWSENERLAKATALHLNTAQVYTLASIVEKESNSKAERATIAGLYLNRLNIGMRLQADPTVVYANQDFTIKRVYSGHLAKDSPYNTYLYAGLPPGPISMPSINSIDAVLNRENHQYLYMCARPDNSGQHAFAETLKAHAVNANRYRQYLQDIGIL
ncbi:MAG: endolytic transglycosylase MltG [Saprospiraceae bacterium]